MTEEKSNKEGSCCKPTSGSGGCCNSKKFIMGILVGIVVAVVAHCFLCGQGGHCNKSPQMCPLTSTHTQAVPVK